MISKYGRLTVLRFAATLIRVLQISLVVIGAASILWGGLALVGDWISRGF
jgi:hypothetical protein